MNSIIVLLNLEETNSFILDITISGTKKFLILETHPIIHIGLICGFKTHSHGIKTKTINHPILQDTYVFILKQKPHRCVTQINNVSIPLMKLLILQTNEEKF